MVICMEESLVNCKGWVPYAIIGIAIIFEIVLVIFILLFLKHNTRSGIGYLYGPLFFLAVYKLLASSSVDPISALAIIVSVYHSIIFLDLSIFEKIQWCFFPNTNHILLYSLRFTGPFITLVVLLVVVFITKHYHRTMLKIFTSPIQGMCLFSGVYLAVWIILNINLPLFVFIAILNAVCLLHFLIQPHKNKWLNISDTLLLSILIYLSFLINHDTTNKATVMIYISTILPLLYILIGGTCFTFGSLCMNIIKAKNKGTQNLINPCRNNVFDSEARIFMKELTQHVQRLIHFVNHSYLKMINNTLLINYHKHLVFVLHYYS